MISRVIFLKNNKIRLLRNLSNAVQHEAAASTVEYPPIMDMSVEAKAIRKKLEWRDKIKRCPTIEEKIMEVNMPRYYGYKCLMLDGSRYPYDTTDFIKYITKTEFQELTEKIIDEKEQKKVDGFLSLIKSDIQDALEFEFDVNQHLEKGSLSPKEIQRDHASRLVKQLNRILINALGADNHHLFESDSDIDPRVEAFWFVGKIVPPKLVQIRRYIKEFTRPFKMTPVDRSMQYVGKPLLTLRHQNPLEPFNEIDFESLTAQNENIPFESVSSIDPTSFGWNHQHRHAVCVPGFWAGNVREYGLLSYHDRSFMIDRKKKNFGAADDQNAIHSHGMLSAYAWAYTQACYQGFSTYNDMTYPLSTQNIVTDGQLWSFYKYQLNTTIIHTELDAPNYKYNQCWGTKEMKLYEHIDEHGKIHGLNDDVLKNLIQFYINDPKKRDYEMKPYLDPKEKKIADIEDVERRQWLEKTYKYLVSNRPRQYTVPEIYNWEHIYKIQFPSMPMDNKTRFFELGINPFQRRLDEHIPEYIPRQFRPNGIHDKKKRRATYYPLDHRSNDPRTMSHSLFGAAKEGIRRKYDRYRRSFM